MVSMETSLKSSSPSPISENSASPSAFAGNDFAVCENETVQLTGIIENAETFTWSTLGDGLFDVSLYLKLLFKSTARSE